MKLNWLILLTVLAMGLSAGGATGKTLRIVSYNIDCSDKNSDGNITNSIHSLPTVVQAIGLHHLGTNAQPVDVMSCEELNSTTLSNFVVQLNAIYGAGTYTYDKTTDPNAGGPDGLIYRTNSVQVISARALPNSANVLLQSSGSYTAAHFITQSETVPRAPMVYQLRPINYGSNEDFYFYVSHARASSSDDAVGDARYAEAQEVRSDAKYKLPLGAHILYGGDWNLDNGSDENAYQCLTGQTTSDGIDWADTNLFVWANTNQTQGYDPTSKTTPPTTTTFVNGTADIGTYLYDDSTQAGTYAMSSRLDIQLPNALMFAAYNTNGGVQLAPDTADPYDISNFPASQYPYAFETFGNDGSSTRGSTATDASNHSLNDLASTTPNATTVYTDLLEAGTGSGSTFTGSDHYPIFGDYNIVVPSPAAPVLTAQGFGTNQFFKMKLVSSTNTGFGINASTNLTSWTPIGSGTTDVSGTLLFQDTNAASFPRRFYRAYWPPP